MKNEAFEREELGREYESNIKACVIGMKGLKIGVECGPEKV